MIRNARQSAGSRSLVKPGLVAKVSDESDLSDVMANAPMLANGG